MSYWVFLVVAQRTQKLQFIHLIGFFSLIINMISCLHHRCYPQGSIYYKKLHTFIFRIILFWSNFGKKLDIAITTIIWLRAVISKGACKLRTNTIPLNDFSNPKWLSDYVFTIIKFKGNSLMDFETVFSLPKTWEWNIKFSYVHVFLLIAYDPL